MAAKLKIEKRGDEIKKNSSLLKLVRLWGPSWSKGRTAGQIFGREPSNDYFIKILFLLSKWFQKRRFLWEFPIGSYVKLSSAYITGFFMKFELLPILTDYAY
jgi:hypothetical protein